MNHPSERLLSSQGLRATFSLLRLLYVPFLGVCEVCYGLIAAVPLAASDTLSAHRATGSNTIRTTSIHQGDSSQNIREGKLLR